MANINQAFLNDVFAAFSARFRDGQQRGRIPPVGDASLLKYLVKFAEIAMEVPSTVAKEMHTWIQQIPGFTQWVGDRTAQLLAASGLEVENLDWQQTVEVPRNAMEDDSYGAYGNLFGAMGAEASRDAIWLDMVIDAIRAGSNWVDGNPFFDNDRVYGANTIDNFLGAALSRANFKTAVSLMLGYKGANSLPLNVSPYMLLCGVTTFWTAKELMESEQLSESSVTVTNDVRGFCVPRFSQRLDADEWYLLGMQSSYKPAAAQIRKEGNALDRKDSPTDDNVFYAKKYVYGADARGAGFVPFPHLIVRGYRSGTSGAPAPAAAPKPAAKK